MRDINYMNRCLELAKKGLGTTRPNPSVGAVLVFENQIIGEGFTSAYGGNHAEVNAINSVKNKELLSKSTLYVTLEPCSHHGKTPPCSDLIIKSKIPKVVIGVVDDNSIVAGKGIKKLKSNGVEVIVGVLEKDCKEHHKRFFTYHTKNRPYVILKWAQTKDGFIAPKTKSEQKPVWITNKKSRQLVHQWRAEEHAILVGANTVLQDNPSLTVREVKGENPVRVILDNNNSLSKEYQVFNDEAKTLLVNKTNPKEVLDVLFQNKIQSVIIEGGSKTLQSFIDTNHWDEAKVFIGDVNFGEGVLAPKFEKVPKLKRNILYDDLKIYKND